jgi:hypothetical protein
VIGPAPIAPGTFSRCYPTPQPAPPTHHSTDAITIAATSTGVMAGDPVDAADQARTLVDGALVHVAVPNVTSQTGFLVRNQSGRLLAVTATHGLVEARNGLVGLGDITVVDQQGRRSGVLAGCAIFQTKGAFLDGLPADGGVLDLDVTVLVLDTPIGTSTLTVAPTGPQRGTWYTVVDARTDKVNDTDWYGATLHDHYDVLAVGNTRQGLDGASGTGDGLGAGDGWFLSGLQPRRSTAGQIDFVRPGASGAPLLTVPTTPGAAPQVVGEVVGSIPDHPLAPQRLTDLFGVTITGPGQAPLPKASYATPAPVITAAIAATNALPAPRTSPPSSEPTR